VGRLETSRDTLRQVGRRSGPRSLNWRSGVAARPLLSVEPSTTPAPSDAEVDRKIEGSKRLLRMCRQGYAKDLVAVKLKIVIAPTGEVAEVELEVDQAAGPFVECTRKALKSLSFAPFSGEPAVYEREVDLSGA